MAILTDMYGGRARCTFHEKAHTYHFRVPGVVEKLWQPSVTGNLAMKAKPALVGWAAKESLSVVRRLLGEHQSEEGESALVSPAMIENWLSDAEENWREEDDSTTIGTVAHRFAYEELRYRAGLTPNKPRFPIEANPVLMPDFTAAMLEATNASALQVVRLFDEHHLQPVLMERPLWSPTEGYCGTPDYVGLFDGELAVMDYKTSKRIYSEVWGQLAALKKMFEEEFPDQHIVKRVAVNVPKDGGDLEIQIRNHDGRYEQDLKMYRACFDIYRWNRANDDYAAGNPVQILGELPAPKDPEFVRLMTCSQCGKEDCNFDHWPAQRQNSVASDCPF